MNWSIDAELRSLLVCPICRGPLADVERGLLCTVDKGVFPVLEGIPMMVREHLLEPTSEEWQQATKVVVD